MAEPDFSVTTPDWLKTGRDVGDEWLRTRADTRQQRELSMREREQAALLPLKQREAEQNVQLNSLRIGDEFKKRQDTIDAELAAQQLVQGPIADLLKQGETEKALDAYLEAGIRNPNLRKSKAYGEMADDLRFSIQVKENLKIRREMEEGRTTRAQEANDVKILIEQAKLDLAADPNNLQNQLKLANLYARLQGLYIAQGNLAQRIQGTELRRNAAVQGAVSAEARLADEGFKPAPGVSFMPPPAAGTSATNAPAVPRGAGLGEPLVVPTARPLTTGAVTQQQESLLAAQSALSQVAKLEPLINSGTFGPVAFVENKFIDKFMENFVPGILNKERVEARTVAAGLIAATTRAVRSDSNITEKERQSIISDLPDPRKFLTSPGEAMVQLRTINNGIIDRAVRAAAALHQPTPIDPDIITDSKLIKFMVEKNMLTREQALDWGRRHLPK